MDRSHAQLLNMHDTLCAALRDTLAGMDEMALVAMGTRLAQEMGSTNDWRALRALLACQALTAFLLKEKEDAASK